MAAPRDGDPGAEPVGGRDVPLLLSVGYVACHWCRVMAHESFEDEATAAHLNVHSLKVDREQRPGADAVFLQATTAMTGQGGWPMTVLMNRDGAPFPAGTYSPDRPRHGQPAFRKVPRSAGWSLAAAETALAGPLVVAVVGAAGDPSRDALERVARSSTSPGAPAAGALRAPPRVTGRRDPAPARRP